jgi:long-subunit fatty acid transport protein
LISSTPERGSAFVAVADDATAAFTNPAGLTFGSRTLEASAEVRYRRLDTPFLSVGRLSGIPSGQGLDTVSGPVYGVSVDSAVRPYFVSLAYSNGRWALAAYRHELVFQNNSFLSQGPFFLAAGTFDGRLLGLSALREIGIVTYGASAAYRLSPHVSIGEGFALYHFSLSSSFAAVNANSFYDQVDPTTAGENASATQDGSGTQVAFNVGALVTVNRAVRVGAVFRQSASFRFSQVNSAPGAADVSRSGTFHTPGVFGVGVRLQPTETWAVAADYDRVQYSHLTMDFITLQVDPAVSDRIGIADGNEFHVGTEYTFVGWGNLSIRAGAWFDPNHAIQYRSDGSGSDTDTRFKAVFPGGTSVWHYCGGLGLPLSRSLEINIGSDFTSRRRYISASIVARFGK